MSKRCQKSYIILNNIKILLSNVRCLSNLWKNPAIAQSWEKLDWTNLWFRFWLPNSIHYFKVAKKSLGATMSELYAMTLIVACLAFTATEIISEQIMLDFFESWGFYTYLYRWVNYVHIYFLIASSCIKSLSILVFILIKSSIFKNLLYIVQFIKTVYVYRNCIGTY